jgi:hypothetical protein
MNVPGDIQVGSGNKKWKPPAFAVAFRFASLARGIGWPRFKPASWRM